MAKRFKYIYRLMAQGQKEVEAKDGKKITWHVPHYSDEKYVIAPDEDTALYAMRQKLKNKWIGFRVFPQKTEEMN